MIDYLQFATGILDLTIIEDIKQELKKSKQSSCIHGDDSLIFSNSFQNFENLVNFIKVFLKISKKYEIPATEITQILWKVQTYGNSQIGFSNGFISKIPNERNKKIENINNLNIGLI